jgi:hypothetical protein
MRPDNERRRNQVNDVQIHRAVVRRLVCHTCAFFVLSLLLGLLVRFLANPSRGIYESLSASLSSGVPYLVVLLAILPLFIWDTVNLSNRIVGPVCRLRTAMYRVSQGEEVSPLRFREGDFWREMAADFNTLTERLRQAEHEHVCEQRGDELAEA